MNHKEKINELLSEKLTISKRVICGKHDLRKDYYFDDAKIKKLILQLSKELPNRAQMELPVNVFKSVGDLYEYFKGDPSAEGYDKYHVSVRVRVILANIADTSLKAMDGQLPLADFGIESLEMIEASMLVTAEFNVDASDSMTIEGWNTITTVDDAVMITRELVHDSRDAR